MKIPKHIKHFLTIVISMGCFAVHAQQQGLYSQYMMNYYMVNPAAAGTDNNLDIRAGYRQQWSGIPEAPKNYYLSGHAPIDKEHGRSRRKQEAYHVVGGLFTGQTLGLLTHNTGYATYAYHLPLSPKWVMSVGANIGFSQFKLDYEKMDWGDNLYDPSIDGGNATNFDAAMGIWINSDQWFMGVSSQQILENDLSFSETPGSNGVMNRHYYLTGGSRIPLNRNFDFIPSLMLRKTITALQVDVNSKFRYKDLFWAGFSYRRTDAFLTMIGVGFPVKRSGFGGRTNVRDGRIEIGYSYDFITSRLSDYSGGSHEIMIAFILPKKEKVKCPKFW